MATTEMRNGMFHGLWNKAKLSYEAIIYTNHYDEITKDQQSIGERIVELFNRDYNRMIRVNAHRPVVQIYGQNLGSEYCVFVKKHSQDDSSLASECVLTMIINLRSEDSSVRYYWGGGDYESIRSSTYHITLSCLDYLLPDISSKLISNLVL